MNSVMEIAWNDSPTPILRKSKGKVVWKCPYYKRWKKILDRCYGKSNLIDNPTYYPVTVCNEWLYFSNFKNWMIEQESLLGDLSNLHIDKDLLVRDNLVYSPTTCTFLHPKVNNFMTECKNGKVFCEIGYKIRVYDSGKIKYQARCCNPFRLGSREADSLGCFDSKVEAHLAWKARKLHYAKLLVDKGFTLSQEQSIALIKRYS